MMKRVVKDNWSGAHYEEQANGKWRNIGYSPQKKPIDDIEYSLYPSTKKGGRFTLIQKKEESQKILLII